MGARYTLFYSPGAASLAVHWMLLELSVDLAIVKVDFETREQKSADYLKLNPDGVVPTLLIDGKPHGEAAALLMLLAERHGKRGFYVAEGALERADYLQWMFHLANTVQPAYRLWFYPHEGAGPNNVEATKAEAQKRIEGAWEKIDGLLSGGRPYFLGDSMTSVDFMATMLARWSRNMPKPAHEWPSVAAYLKRMKQMPSLKETHVREGLTDWIDD